MPYRIDVDKLKDIPDVSDEELISRGKNSDQKAIEALLYRYRYIGIGYAKKICDVGGMSGEKILKEDILSYYYVSVLETIEIYDPKRENKSFGKLVEFCLKNEVEKVNKVPRKVREIWRAKRELEDTILQKEGWSREPTIEEIQKLLPGTSKKTIIKAITFGIARLDKPVSCEGDETLQDVLEDKDISKSPDRLAERNSNDELLAIKEVLAIIEEGMEKLFFKGKRSSRKNEKGYRNNKENVLLFGG